MSKRPNFLLIVADDLGFSDVGCFGGEISTPNLDKLAKDGIRFSDFHTAAACSPTRSMLLSGTDNHIAGVGVMYEYRAQDPERWNLPGHEGYLNYDVAAMPELLQDAGYHTMLSGKWHLGFREQHLPAARGFEKSWGHLPGCSNHFGWEPVWRDNDGAFPRLPGHLPLLYVEDGVKTMPVPNKDNSPDGFYSSDFYANKLVSNLQDRPKDKPFFGFLPFTAPHWPLQCLPEYRDKYRGRYDQGPGALRQSRLARMRELGMVDTDVKAHEVVASTLEWDEMSDEERRMSARSMEVYAGMVDSIDVAIGKVVNYLEEEGILDDTVVMFMSDNGAEGAAMESIPVMGTRLLQAIEKYYDNSYENLGNHDSFIWYGPRWAQASTAPNRLMKGWITEGGIRVPFLVRYPKFTAYKPGDICRSFTTCMDILPTFLDLAQTSHPNPNPSHPREKARYRDRQVFAMRGKSWMHHLTGPGYSSDDSLAIHSEDDAPVGWEMHGRASLRKGKWKIVNIPLGHPTGTGTWQLYDLSKDQGETIDLANRYPDKVTEMVEAWTAYQEQTGTVFGPPIGKPIIDPATGRPSLLPDQIGGDPMDDQKIWMNLGAGKRFRDEPEGAKKVAL